jgi:hypothetical protein
LFWKDLPDSESNLFVLAGPRGGAGLPGASFAEQLSEKGSRHSMLLACLSESGVLHRLVPEVQRTLLDNAEKLEVVTALLRLLQVCAEMCASFYISIPPTHTSHTALVIADVCRNARFG